MGESYFMNIGIVTTWFERGAAYVSRQYYELLKDDHEVFIYARGGESYAMNDPAWDGKRVTWDKDRKKPVINYVDLKGFQNWLKEKKIELVFFNEQQWWEPVIFCNRLGIKTGSYIDYYTEESIPLFKCYDFLICNTKRHYSAFNWHPQTIYIPWGTDIKTFSPKKRDLIEPGVLTFFHSAGFSPFRKGTDLVLEAFKDIEGSAKLVIHTQCNLIEAFPKLQTLIKSLESQNKLICYEDTVSAPGLYHLGDVYVYPSRLDGIGLTIVEALACGLPIVTSNNPPMNEFINEANGRLVEIDRLFSRSDGYYWPQCLVDVDHLRHQMQMYVDQIDLIGEFQQSARSYAEKYLDWSKNAQELSQLFASIKDIPNHEKLEAIQQAQAFDKKRAPLPLKFPVLYEIAKLGIELLRKMKVFNK
jgi:1,2-diacylglycerol 3-alpha-glucosyltransferase